MNIETSLMINSTLSDLETRSEVALHYSRAERYECHRQPKVECIVGPRPTSLETNNSGDRTTWYSNSDRTFNTAGHILISGRSWVTSDYCSAELGSTDRRLLAASL